VNEIKDLLLISAIPINGKGQYPHLTETYEWLRNYFNCDHILVEERGLNLQKVVSKYKNNKKSLNPFTKLLIDTKSLREIYKHYEVIIALDDFTYISARLANMKNCILWSHDFIPNDNVNFGNILNRAIRFMIKFILKPKKIIIQDPQRFKLYCDTYRIKRQINVFYLPVALNKINDVEIKKKYDIGLIQIGGINCERSMSDRFLNFVLRSQIQLRCLFHGFVKDDFRSMTHSLSSNRFEISENDLEPSQLPNLIKKYQIGLVGYEAFDRNFQLISMASNQVVEYLRCGMPMIVMGNSNLNEFVEKHKIGFSIQSQSEFDFAVNKLVDDYFEYNNNCIKTYNLYFQLDQYIGDLVAFLKM
jgi:hypothetical protein